MFVSVSFCLPQFVDVSAFSIFSVLSALSFVSCVCLPKVSLGSNVSPSMVGFGTVGRIVSSIFKFRIVLYSAGSGVKRVVVVFPAFRWRSFVFVQSVTLSR